MKRLTSNVTLVVVHDAGAAELIGAYVRAHATRIQFHCYVAGPAEKIFRRLKLPFHHAPKSTEAFKKIIRLYPKAESILLGTGWMTVLERNARRAARTAGIKTVCYLDSWTNYRERFGYPRRGWEKNVPNEIWVADRAGLALAHRFFTDISIRLVPNQYMSDILSRFRKGHRHPNKVLFMGTAPSDRESEKLLDALLQYCSKLDRPPIVRVRLHPADPLDRYSEIVKRYRGSLRIEQSQDRDLVEDLLCARLVIGVETAAMVLAARAGLKTVSILPPGHLPILPVKKIIRRQWSSGKTLDLKPYL